MPPSFQGDNTTAAWKHLFQTLTHHNMGSLAQAGSLIFQQNEEWVAVRLGIQEAHSGGVSHLNGEQQLKVCPHSPAFSNNGGQLSQCFSVLVTPENYRHLQTQPRKKQWPTAGVRMQGSWEQGALKGRQQIRANLARTSDRPTDSEEACPMQG